MKKKTVLLVDRHPAMLESIRGILEILFDSVVMVSDERSLLDIFLKLDPDLVVADHTLKVSRESDVICLLHKANPKTRIIALGTYKSADLAKKCISSGASGYVIKGLAAKELIKAIEEEYNPNIIESINCDV